MQEDDHGSASTRVLVLYRPSRQLYFRHGHTSASKSYVFVARLIQARPHLRVPPSAARSAPSSPPLYGVPREDVGAPGLRLDVLAVRRPFDYLLHLEARLSQQALHILRAEEVEVYEYLLAPQLVESPDLVADVEGEQEQAARPEDAPQFPEGARHLLAREVDDGVERDDAAPRAVLGVQGAHVPLPELDPRVQASGLLDHAGRKVHAERLRPEAAQVARDVPGPAPQIAHRSQPPGLLREPGEKLAVERFVTQFVEQVLGVLPGEPIVARPQAAGLVPLLHPLPPFVAVRCPGLGYNPCDFGSFGPSGACLRRVWSPVLGRYYKGA